MAIRMAHVQIKGSSALLMHRFPLEPIESIEKKSPAEQAEISAYRDPSTKQLCIPAVAFQRALVAGAAYSKGKGRSTLAKQVAACVIVTPEYALLGVDTYAIDSRAVVVPATKGRVVRHRPRIEAWEVNFDVEFDDVLLNENDLHKIITNTGSRVGLLDFRPEKKGPFGRFLLTHFSVEKEAIGESPAEDLPDEDEEGDEEETETEEVAPKRRGRPAAATA